MAKKRSNGEGTLRLRADGRWECTVMDGYAPNGKRKYKSFYGKTQKAVKEQMRQYQEDKKAGLNLDQSLRFEPWAEEWFAGHSVNISPTTQESYRYTLRILNREFGNRCLTDIKAVDVEHFLKKLRAEGKGDSYLAKCRGMLFQIMNKAEANDLIRKNPVRFAEKMSASGPAAVKEAFTAEEVNLLMTHLPDDRMGNSIRLLLGTGMRMQELLALEPKHIAEDGTCIHVRQAVKLVKGTPQIGSPKTRDSVRDIPVPKHLQACAAAMRDTDHRFIWEAGVKGQPCNPANFRRTFKSYLAKVPGVRVLTPHCCRHTYVSQMQALGVDLATIQSIVGHADLDMTQHYLHVQETVRLDAASRFSAAFGQNTEVGESA